MARILVADDDRVIRGLLSDIVTDAGHDAIEAEDGGVAFEKAFVEKPDLILLDMMMPVMDGMQVLTELKKNPDTCSIPIICVTALGQERNEIDAMRAGAWDYISKPWGPSEVEERIRMALDRLAA